MNGGSDVSLDDAELAVDLGGTALDRRQSPDQRRVDRDAGEREVLHRPLRLRSPERLRRHSDLAHRVMFDPKVVTHARMVPHRTRSYDAAPLSRDRSWPTEVQSWGKQ